MNFGDTLRFLIEEREITQKKLANDLNIAPSTIGGYVQNSSEPDFNALKLLASYFNVSTDYLLDFHNGKTDTHLEDELLRLFRLLTADEKLLYVEQGRAFNKMKHR